MIRSLRFACVAVALAALLLPVEGSTARPSAKSTVTLNMLAFNTQQPGFSVLIPNFERVYPDITVNVNYSPNVPQLETVELAGGSGPDPITTFPGCGTPESVCELAKAGELAPLLKEPWTKRSLPLVTSLSKYGRGLYAFEPSVTPYGIFTNDALFTKLRLKVPQTFSQLLELCAKSKAAGTVAFVLSGGDGLSTGLLLTDLAVATVYGKDAHWPAKLKAGSVSFDGTAGWHQALQEFIDLNNAGCFQQGAAGTSAASSRVEFAQGQGLMYPGISGFGGALVTANPQLVYSFHPFPGGTGPNQTTTFLNLSPSLSVDAHASAQNRAAAQTLIDFMARPKQNALYANANGSLTQYQFLKGQLPTYMVPFASVFKQHEYVMNPQQTWWNANVLLALQQAGIGLITGQTTIDDLLQAMDAAWKHGPS
jgi:raffinose/stachyose/melibiose transport system substrate-binding protein